MRKKIVAGNWKMNLNTDQGISLVNDLIKEKIDLKYNQTVIICPPFTHIGALKMLLDNNEGSKIQLGAQNISDKASGAYTGEISGEMLKHLDTRYVIVGHSERREVYNESNEMVQKKVDAVLSSKMTPIFCCGEPLKVREVENQNDYVQQQIEEGLFHLNGETMSSLIIAYEPIWAIGTGRTASAAQAEEMHAFIRSILEKKWGSEIAEDVTILYGGSVKPDNAQELFSQDNVDGGLIGGAALDANSFIDIIKALA